jgi:ferredoxin
VTYVITRLCRDCKDLGCVNVCPTSCIVEHRPEGAPSDLPNQLFIDPDDCIDCNACVPQCPWEAIYPDVDLPLALAPDLELNALASARRAEFQRPEVVRGPLPAPAEIAENKRRWRV